MLNAVPAWVCPQCGEFFFEETEVESIQAALQKLDEQTEKLARAA